MPKIAGNAADKIEIRVSKRDALVKNALHGVKVIDSEEDFWKAREIFEKRSDDMLDRITRAHKAFAKRNEKDTESIAYLVVTHQPVVQFLATKFISDARSITTADYCASFETMMMEGSKVPITLKGVNDDYIEKSEAK